VSRKVQIFGWCWGALAATLLCGWYGAGWSFVDPFLAMLFLISSPFFVAMGVVNPRPAEISEAALVERHPRIG
jgi:hypothetical protein